MFLKEFGFVAVFASLSLTQAFPFEEETQTDGVESDVDTVDVSSEYIILRKRKGEKKGTMDHCEYLHQLGIYTPECEVRGFTAPTDPTTTTTTTTPAPPPMCTRKFFQDRCRFHPQCGQSGMMCRDVANNLCCKPSDDVCPTQEQLGIICSKVARLVSWCSTDSHCTRGTKCCPSGCGYNICV
ncbi:unnamed protein product, partial [Mesorhabditis belari]|uniref:WAP domain-containing protein n=1 Tax=Mesorhabditis belari TaxID=2138241 RepID=A0AAF3F1K2_9BILA